MMILAGCATNGRLLAYSFNPSNGLMGILTGVVYISGSPYRGAARFNAESANPAKNRLPTYRAWLG
jgi:hypothetical protein